MEFWVKGNVALRPLTFDAPGEQVEGHKHNFDHVTYVTRGALLVEKLCEDGSVESSVVKRAGEEIAFVHIEAGKRHRITSLRVETVFTDLMLKAITESLQEAGLAIPDPRVLEVAVRTAQSMDQRSAGHCVYAHRTPQGEVVLTYDGWSPAYE